MEPRMGHQLLQHSVRLLFWQHVRWPDGLQTC